MVSRDCCMALPHGAMGLSAVCDCDFLIILTYYFTYIYITTLRCNMVNSDVTFLHKDVLLTNGCHIFT